MTALVTWWSGTPNALDGNRFEGAEFDTQNVVPIAFALFAVALGIAAGCGLPPHASRARHDRRRLRRGPAGRRRSTCARTTWRRSRSRSRSGRDRTPLPSGSWTMSRYIVDPVRPLNRRPAPGPRRVQFVRRRQGRRAELPRAGSATTRSSSSNPRAAIGTSSGSRPASSSSSPPPPSGSRSSTRCTTTPSREIRPSSTCISAAGIAIRTRAVAYIQTARRGSGMRAQGRYALAFAREGECSFGLSCDSWCPTSTR